MKKPKSEVLYFPSIEFYDDTWLKGALCHWDKIYRIVPPSYTPQDNDEVKQAVDAGLVESIKLSSGDLSDTAEKFVEFWNSAPIVPAGFDGYDEEPIRLHPEKVDERIRGQLAALSQHIDKDGFLSLSKEVANSYMLFLSDSVSRRRLIPKITDDADMFMAMSYFEQDGNFDEAVYSDERDEVTATLALPSLVPSGIGTFPMQKVIKFHRESMEGREAFRLAVSVLIDELKDIKDKEFFLKRISKFDNDLRSSSNSIGSVLKSGKADFAYALVTAGLPMALSSFSVMGMAGDPWNFQTIGQSALLGVVAALADHTRNRRSTWSSKEASYWLSLNSAFKEDSGIRLSLPRFHSKFEEFIND